MVHDSPEAVLAQSARDRNGPLSDDDRAALLARAERMAAQGLRVIALATTEPRKLPGTPDRDDLVFVGMAGKLTKLASGVLMTHYTRSRVDTAVLVEITGELSDDAALLEGVAAANTARHAYEQWEAAGVLRPAGDALVIDLPTSTGRSLSEYAPQQPDAPAAIGVSS